MLLVVTVGDVIRLPTVETPASVHDVVNRLGEQGVEVDEVERGDVFWCVKAVYTETLPLPDVLNGVRMDYEDCLCVYGSRRNVPIKIEARVKKSGE